MAIPDEDLPGLLDAARFMDANECRTVLEAAKSSAGKPPAHDGDEKQWVGHTRDDGEHEQRTEGCQMLG